MVSVEGLDIRYGIARFEGLFGWWYAWAKTPDRELTGPNRMFKFRAKRDVDDLVAKLKRLPSTHEVPRFDSEERT